jgi:hypothetical protein
MHQYQKQTTSWLFIALVLSSHGIAMASRIEEHGTGGKLEWFGRRSQPNINDAQEEYSDMSCEQLSVAMHATMAEVSAQMSEKCNAESCAFHDSDSGDIQNLSVLAMRIAAIADVSDTRMCLPEVLEASGTFQTLEFADRFLASAVSDEARDRFSLAFSALNTAQEEIHALRGEVVDRRLLLPTNIEDPSVCPSPCVECTTQHNSWHRQDETFSFKCILNSEETPQAQGISCADPEPRHGFGHRNQFKTWCEVQDWQDLASQTLSVSAKITCGTKAVMAPIQTGEHMSPSLRSTCESKESGEAVSQEALDQLVELDNTVGDVVSPGNLAIFSVFMAVELTQAVGRLRTATRGSSFISVDASGAIDSSSVGHSVQQSSNHSYTEGSWRCRRGILSLTQGLFGGMIQIIVGVAYLAIMGSFGLLAAIVMFGADNVIATLSPYLGIAEGHTVETISQTTAETIASYIAESPLAVAAGEAGGAAAAEGAAAAAGTVVTAEGTAAAGAAGGAAVEGAIAAELLTTISAQILTITTLVAEFMPFVFGGAIGFAVLFGVWGFLKIWRSMNSPYDCSSGYVGHGAHAVCHPALMYGEGTHAQCPGTTGTENEIAFICARENRGVMTFMGTCAFFEEN